jgi:RNA polymerase sigma-54 factor
MRPELAQTQSLVQRQELIPAQIQSLEILQATIPELEQKINEALAENPTLELISTGREELAGNPTEGDASPAAGEGGADADDDAGAEDGGEAGARPADDGTPPDVAAEFAAEPTAAEDWTRAGDADPVADPWGALSESWSDYLPGESTGHAQSSEEEEARRQHRFDSLVAPTGLQDLLLEQFRQGAPADEAFRRLGEEIIGSIDAAGYLRTHPADIAITCEAEMEEVLRVLRFVQQLDPPGVGARDLRECLLLQLERQGRRDGFEYQLVSRHLEELGRNQIPRVARRLRVSPGRVYEALREIRRLAPYPGHRIETPEAPSTFVVPEVTISRGDHGEWLVESNRESRPRLRLSPCYLRLLRDPDTTPEARSYIRQKLAESKLLLRALDSRESTIARISRVLLRLQPGFFASGPNSLQPLTLTRVATELGLHETTISRAIANKYVRTPHGLFPFKHFFSSGGGLSEAGDRVSEAMVKQKLLEIVRAEDASRPLSDSQIAQSLAAADIRLARRTVAKYREELNIPPSHLRRTFMSRAEPA